MSPPKKTNKNLNHSRKRRIHSLHYLAFRSYLHWRYWLVELLVQSIMIGTLRSVNRNNETRCLGSFYSHPVIISPLPCVARTFWPQLLFLGLHQLFVMEHWNHSWFGSVSLWTALTRQERFSSRLLKWVVCPQMMQAHTLFQQEMLQTYACQH